MGPKAVRGLAMALLGCSLFGIATATPVQWKATDGGNDHLYDIVVNDSHHFSEVVNGIFFRAAAAEAIAMGGYLATPALTGEAAFIYDHLVAPSENGQEHLYWLGAYCTEPGQSYEWVKGGTVTTWGGYTKIDGTREDVPHAIVQGGPHGPALQDLPLSSVANGFVVEFDQPSPPAGSGDRKEAAPGAASAGVAADAPAAVTGSETAGSEEAPR